MSSTNDSRGADATRGLLGGGRHWSAGTPPKDVTGWAITALGVAVFVQASSWATLKGIYTATQILKVAGPLAAGTLIIFGLGVLTLLWPAIQSWRHCQIAKVALAANKLVDVRVATAASREYAYKTLGYAAVVVAASLIAQFFIANNLAVSRTFFQLPLILSTFGLMLKAFWINIYIFVIAEILVLVWGLVVAIARLVPGDAGRPIRVMATVYTDVFRGMPAIINIYLIGFGIPLTGLPILKDLAPESYAILALTLTYGAYVAEVYRSGIESIHWSQVAASRSLGLTYFQTLRHVIVPQAARRIIPPLLNDFIALQKDTALVNVIGSVDAFNQAKIVASNHFNLSPVATVAILFIVITIPQARFVDKMIERDQRRMRGGS